MSFFSYFFGDKEGEERKRQEDRQDVRDRQEHNLAMEGQVTAQLSLQNQIAERKERTAGYKAQEAKSRADEARFQVRMAGARAIQNFDNNEVKRQDLYFQNLQVVRKMVLSMQAGLLVCIYMGGFDVNEDSKLDEALFALGAILFSPKLFKAFTFNLREERRMQRQNINLQAGRIERIAVGRNSLFAEQKPRQIEGQMAPTKRLQIEYPSQNKP